MGLDRIQMWGVRVWVLFAFSLLALRAINDFSQMTILWYTDRGELLGSFNRP